MKGESVQQSAARTLATLQRLRRLPLVTVDPASLTRLQQTVRTSP